MRSTPSASLQDSPGAEGSDLGEGHVPPTEPPGYDEEAVVVELGEEAPPYESPVRGRGEGVPQLPELRRLPAIEVTGSTPGNSVPVTPVDGRGEDEGRTRR